MACVRRRSSKGPGQNARVLQLISLKRQAPELFNGAVSITESDSLGPFQVPVNRAQPWQQLNDSPFELSCLGSGQSSKCLSLSSDGSFRIAPGRVW